jgi:P4 family phage/plasmid primase-like protien
MQSPPFSQSERRKLTGNPDGIGLVRGTAGLLFDAAGTLLDGTLPALAGHVAHVRTLLDALPTSADVGQMSLFSGATSTTPAGALSLADLLDGIQSGKWAAAVEAARAAKLAGDAAGYDARKRALPAVTLSGTFERRAAAALVAHSGIIQIDIDHVADPADLRDRLAGDDHIAAAWLSPGGDGVKAAALIPADAGGHAGAFGALAARLAGLHGVEVDPAVKDVSRLCFVSHDPDLKRNPAARPITPTTTPTSAPDPLPGPTPTRPHHTGRGYGAAALAAEAARVASAAPSTRNNTLFQSAAALAELVNGGELAPHEVRAALEQAARAAGLDDAEIQKTLESAEKRTEGKARTAPPRAATGSGGAMPNGATFPLTDMGNAERIAAQHSATLRYCTGLGWLGWDGQRWQIEEGAAVRAAKTTIRRIYHEAGSDPDPDKRAALAKHAGRSEASSRVAGALSLAKHEPALSVEVGALDAHLDELNTPGGIVDLRTGELSPHDPERLHTKVAGAAPGGDCPLWRAFLHRIFEGDDALIGYLQEAVGASLSGRTSDQVLQFLHGTGANGKSVFTGTLLALAGDYGTRLGSDALMLRYAGGSSVSNDIAALRGARLVIASELADGQRLNESLVKDLTGGDLVSARFLYSEHFTFRPQLSLWLAGNHKPKIAGQDAGIWRRMRLVPFAVSIPPAEQDKQLETKLRHELPGIMAWALAGARRWYGRGRLPDNAAVENATSGYRSDQDVLGRFVEECCIVGANFSAGAGDLHRRLKVWTAENSEREMSATELGRRLSDRGFVRIKSNRVTWRGIGLLDDD